MRKVGAWGSVSTLGVEAGAWTRSSGCNTLGGARRSGGNTLGGADGVVGAGYGKGGEIANGLDMGWFEIPEGGLEELRNGFDVGED
jgi:hypothetical protein